MNRSQVASSVGSGTRGRPASLPKVRDESSSLAFTSFLM
jgi:hypothetical protein